MKKLKEEVFMMKKGKKIIFVLLLFVCCLIGAGVGRYFREGIPVTSLPDAEEILSVEIRDTRLTEETKILKEKEDIVRARKLVNALNHTLSPKTGEEPFLFVNYLLKDGKTVL